jgi:hypothetical protein
MRLILLPLLLGLGLAALPAPVHAQAEKSLTGILVIASPEAGESDRRLAPYESTLRRILRFESFRWVGQGRGRLAPGGSATLNLGAGQSLLVEDGDGGSVQVTWRQGNRVLMRTGLHLRPGVPAVLGGPGSGRAGEVYAVILGSS